MLSANAADPLNLRALSVQADRQRLELVDEGRLDVARLARQLHVREALERLLQEDRELQAREGRAQAEVPPAGAEGLVLGVAVGEEAVGLRVEAGVAVGGH